MFVLFAAPVEKDIDWSDEQVEGILRFLSRAWRAFHARQDSFGAPLDAIEQAEGPFKELRRRTHRTIQRVSEGFEGDLKLNTSIAAMMELVNELTALPAATRDGDRAAVREALDALAHLLCPFAPHVAEELWHELHGAAVRDRLLAQDPWPAFDPALVAADVVTIAIQVNGKLRGEVQAAVSAPEAEVRALAEAESRVKAHLEGKTVRKVVFVPKRLMNFVVS
jgi:leucyl-tRNA synthetase